MAFITNNSFIDGLIHRKMRISSQSFDGIYILDLNAKRKTPDGSKDENVFDIMQGLALIFLLKQVRRKDMGRFCIPKFSVVGKLNM
ncbi:hypothetical protein MASR2M39_12790 [Ignavibacteriales bacterium]